MSSMADRLRSAERRLSQHVAAMEVQNAADDSANQSRISQLEVPFHTSVSRRSSDTKAVFSLVRRFLTHNDDFNTIIRTFFTSCKLVLSRDRSASVIAYPEFINLHMKIAKALYERFDADEAYKHAVLDTLRITESNSVTYVTYQQLWLSLFELASVWTRESRDARLYFDFILRLLFRIASPAPPPPAPAPNSKEEAEPGDERQRRRSPRGGLCMETDPARFNDEYFQRKLPFFEHARDYARERVAALRRYVWTFRPLDAIRSFHDEKPPPQSPEPDLGLYPLLARAGQQRHLKTASQNTAGAPDPGPPEDGSGKPKVARDSAEKAEVG